MSEKAICKDCGCEFTPMTAWESKNQRHNLPKDCLISLKTEVEQLKKKNNDLSCELAKLNEKPN